MERQGIAQLAHDPRGRDEPDPPLVKAIVVTPDPPDTVTGVFFKVPSVDDKHVHGPAPWQPRIVDGDTYAIPSSGDEALVAFDEEGEPWIVLWWPANEPS